jgi:trans-2,3-dihydro-3-hydroxyanthranilate isomerase
VRRFRYVVADVFTDTPLAGNQLAVFTDARDLDPLTMQALAKEMNFSETVFVLPPQSEDADVRIRIFTPATELSFAGHPTLGTAFVLGGPLQKIILRIEMAAGIVPVELEREGPKIVFGWMEQPVPTWEPFERTPELFSALGVAGSGLPVDVYDNGVEHLFVELATPEEVAALTPDTRALGALTWAGAHCFARHGAGWKTRAFFGTFGITEDPATGSGSSRESRSAGRRSSTRAPRAQRSGSSASSSAGRRLSSPAASSVSLEQGRDEVHGVLCGVDGRQTDGPRGDVGAREGIAAAGRVCLHRLR